MGNLAKRGQFRSIFVHFYTNGILLAEGDIPRVNPNENILKKSKITAVPTPY